MMLCPQGRELEPLYELHSAGTQWMDEGFLSPSPEPHCSLPAAASARVVADLRPGPPGRVLIPVRLWVTPTLLHLALCSLAAQTVGRGFEHRFHPWLSLRKFWAASSHHAGWLPAGPPGTAPLLRKEGFLGPPSARGSPSGYHGRGHPHTPHLGS